MQPKPGQFAVIISQFNKWDLIAVQSATTKQFEGVSVWYGGGYERTIPIRDCVYCGDEASARLLHERLVSSEAQRTDEQRKAGERCRARNELLIAAAVAAVATPA